MVLKGHPTKTNLFQTSQPGEGLDLSYAEKIWIKIAQSECRIELLESLTKLKIGLKEVKDYSDSFILKLRSEHFTNKSEKNGEKWISDAMRGKLEDEKWYCKELQWERMGVRRHIKEMFGENSRHTRSLIKHLRSEAEREKTAQRKRYGKKLSYLKGKYERDEKVRLNEVPDDLSIFGEAGVFDDEKFNTIVKDDIQIQIVGNVVMTDDERELLRHHPKFALMTDLKEIDMDMELELAFAKVRYQLLKELGEKLSDEEEEQLEDMTREMEEMIEEEEAKARQVFDPEGKIFDYRKKRVTDLDENTRVILPKPLPPSEEASIEMRRENYRKIFREVKRKITNEKGEQKPNLTETAIKGLKSIKKRIKDEEIIVLKTDKSGKFAITDRENYIEMGKVHTGKDRIVTRKEIREKERVLNGHTSMWLKMTGLGEAHNHEGRARESKIVKSQNLASMYLLLKDHKQKLSTRPVVSGCDSNTLGLSNMVAELLEAICNSMSSPYEVISTEDMLSRIEECNKITIKMREDKIARGEELTDLDQELFVIANDVVALFPSLTSERSGRIVRILTEQSDLEVDGIDYMEVARYIAIERERTGVLDEIEGLLPWRTKSGGTAPGIKNPECNGKEKNTQKFWTFPDRTPTKKQKRIMLGRMAEIGVRTLFENFCYSFAGESYIQQSGGPIGARVTMAVARLVMHDWGMKYQEILTKSGLDVQLFGGYVDDGRQATSRLPLGMKFDKEAGMFIHKAEWEVEDEVENLPTVVRMGKVCLEAMNNINPDLEFTVETVYDFKTRRLPTLDFEMWVEDGIIKHSYYEKPMRTQIVLMKDSSMGQRQKMDILANELIRRLSNVGEGIEMREKIDIVDHYSK